MLKKTKVAAIAILASIILATTPAMLLAQGQVQTAPAQQIVTLAERAAQQVQNLIDMINANEDALAQIDTVGLADEFDANVTLYEIDGLKKLADVQEALTNAKYEDAVDSAVEALSIFREVYSSIHVIMKAADLQRDDLIENQGLLEAIAREQQRIDRLREILSVDALQDIFDTLDATTGLLSEAKTLVLDGDVDAAKSTFLKAKENISEVYDYLKEQAVDSNTWRLYNYCEQAQERIRERFRYGQDQGVDFTSVLQSYGYQTESQFMEALQNRTQTAQGEQNFSNAMQDCDEVSQMVQQMEQTLNQEIYRQRGQNSSGFGGSGSVSGNGGSGSGYGGSGGGL